MNKDGNTKKQATRKREREKKENPKKEEEIKEHDGPKSSRGEESRRHKTSCSVTCPFNVPVEANEKWRPYSLPLRPFNRGYLPLCYDSKTSLGSPRSSLIYEPTTVPFVIPPSLYLLSPPSPSLFFHIVQASYRRVPPRHLAHASKRVHCSCTSNPALDTVSIA